jgi:hypothetical protein
LHPYSHAFLQLASWMSDMPFKIRGIHMNWQEIHALAEYMQSRPPWGSRLEGETGCVWKL